jgi:hypothetical protein
VAATDALERAVAYDGAMNSNPLHTLRNFRRLPRVAVALAVAAAAAAVAAPVASADPAVPDVPDTIAVDGPFKPFLETHADGVQVYRCGWGGTSYQWLFVAPFATLTGPNGKVVGDHSPGPRWTARDGSLVIGRRVDGVTVDETAIPWLKLEATTTISGSDGDRLTGTAWIQRINTVGGIAPAASECDEEAFGTMVDVPYTADYVFWKRAG